MKVPLLLTVPAVGLVLFAAACGDDGDGTPTATIPPATSSPQPSPAATSTATRPAASATSTATRPAPSATPTRTGAPVDGTVDPLGGGQQTLWTVKGSTDPFTGVATVKALRMGLHPELGGWERIVFEFAGPARPPAVVRYVDKAVGCGSGQTLATQGTAILEVAITNAQAHDDAGKPTIPTTLAGPGGTVINSGLSSCDFEGHVTWDFGLNGKHNFKVTTLANPTRIVIDIKQ